MGKRLKVKLHRKDVFFALFVLTYAIRAYTDALFVSRGTDSVWVLSKYMVLICAILYGACYLLSWKKRIHHIRVIKVIGFTCAVFLLITCAKMFYTGVYSTAIVELIFYMLQASVVSMLVANIGTQDDVYKALCWILCICVFVYSVFEIGLEYFESAYFGQISFDESYSPFESHYTSGTAMALCAYFCYFRKSKFFTILSVAFSLLVFKRLSVVCSILLFVLPLFFDMRRKVNYNVSRICALFFCIGTLAYYWCLIPQNQNILLSALNINSVEKFTSSRSGFFVDVYTSPFFVNFGWGACETYLGRMLEMDLIQMLIEVSFVGLAVFSFSYWSLAGTSVYGLVYMGFNFLNMLFSHSIQNGFVWSLILITLLEIDKPVVNINSRNK